MYGDLRRPAGRGRLYSAAVHAKVERCRCRYRAEDQRRSIDSLISTAVSINVPAEIRIVGMRIKVFACIRAASSTGVTRGSEGSVAGGR